MEMVPAVDPIGPRGQQAGGRVLYERTMKPDIAGQDEGVMPSQRLRKLQAGSDPQAAAAEMEGGKPNRCSIGPKAGGPRKTGDGSFHGIASRIHGEGKRLSQRHRGIKYTCLNGCQRQPE